MHTREVRLGNSLMAVILAVALPRVAAAHSASAVDIHHLAEKAELIFRGRVTAVQYRESEPVPVLDAAGAVVVGRNGQPLMQDASDTPHTFVTYAIERVFRGAPSRSTLTLRFFGGVYDEPFRGLDEEGNPIVAPRELRPLPAPLFDIGDQDILFVRGNTASDCPLVGCSRGRFRVVQTGVRQAMIFTEDGHEVVRAGRARDAEVMLGRLNPPREVLAHRAAPNLEEIVLTITQSTDPNEMADPDPDNPVGPHLDLRRFEQLLRRAVRTSGSLTAPPTVPNADPTVPFFGRPLLEIATPLPEPALPVVRAPERPWIDALPAAERDALLAEEQAEADLLSANGGNPVLR